MKKTLISSALCLLCAAACTKDPGFDSIDGGKTIIRVTSDATKTTLGEIYDGVRPVLWTKGDAINMNGIASAALDIEESALSADFVFEGTLEAPYNAVYPASAYSDGALNLSAYQEGTADNISNGQLPMVGSSEDGNIIMQQVCGLLGISLKAEGEGVKIRHIEVSTKGGEQICGKFNIDFNTLTISADGTGGNSITLITQAELSAEALNFNVVIPAGIYSDGFTVKVVDELGRVMVKTLYGSRSIVAHKLMALPEITFLPNAPEEALEISSAAEWNSFVTAYNNKECPSSQIVKITQDLDFSETTEYIPLGKKTTQAKFPAEKNIYFEGTLLGGGHTIKNLDTDIPLIQAIGANALVQDLSIDSTCDFTVWYDGKSQIEFGPLAAYCSAGTIKNCHTAANITLAQLNDIANSNKMYVGGFIGRNRAAQIFDCTSASTITVDESYVVTPGKKQYYFYIGGFTGYCSNELGLIERCSNTGDITIAGTAVNIYAGGICANATAGTLKDCTNSGNISFNTPRAKGDPCKFFVAGGIAGENAMNIIGCSNSGNILSKSNVKQHMLGGIAGQITKENITLTDNTNSGNITTTSGLRNLYCGGLYGQIKAVQDNLVLNGEPSTGIINIGETENSTTSYLYCGGLIGQAMANIKVSGNATWTKSIDYTVTADNAAAESFFGGIMGCAYKASVSLSGFSSAGAITINSAKAKFSHSVSAMGGILGGSTVGATIEDCVNSSTVRMTTSTNQDNGKIMHIGGIAGLVRGGEVVIRNCSNSAQLSNQAYNNNTWTAYTGNFTGGIIGSVGHVANNTFESIIENCTLTGRVYAYRGGAGGIAGYASKTAISGCNVLTDSNEYTIYRGAPSGGIVGVSENCSISNCIVKKTVHAEDAGTCKGYAGGIVGECVGTSIDGSKYYGDLTGVDYVGGIIGLADAASTIGTTAACSFGGTIGDTVVTADNFSTIPADGSGAATVGTVTLWDGTL